jgi:hypothetical protein
MKVFVQSKLARAEISDNYFLHAFFEFAAHTLRA